MQRKKKTRVFCIVNIYVVSAHVIVKKKDILSSPACRAPARIYMYARGGRVYLTVVR